MKLRIECPYCDGVAVLQKQLQDLTYRKESFTVNEHFYKCEKCHEEFTTTESDTMTIMQAHNQYREKHGIPFPEELTSIRERYGLSASKMSEVLGLGVNGYSNYERGEMPNAAIAKLIKTAAKPEIFLEFLENTKDFFSENLFNKTVQRIHKLIKEPKEYFFFHITLNIYQEPNSYTGFKKFDVNKVAYLVVFFIKSSTQTYNDKLKLNKQLFYTDFRHYKNYGKSITGLSYRAIDYGPVPANYDNVFTYLENKELICSDWVKTNSGSAVEIFSTKMEFKHELFSVEEIETMEAIVILFEKVSSWELVEKSHEEKGWQDLKNGRNLISYQAYAFDLKGA